MTANLTDATSIEIRNVAFDSAESYSREVVFGPPSKDIVILIERDPTEGAYTVSVGNGPFHSDIPELIPGILEEVAGFIAELSDSSEFLDAAVASEA